MCSGSVNIIYTSPAPTKASSLKPFQGITTVLELVFLEKKLYAHTFIFLNQQLGKLLKLLQIPKKNVKMP